MVAIAGETISWLQALLLGIVEGITEYLPISSTGHLIIASKFLGLESVEGHQAQEAVQAFEIVIQSGAILAVLLIYWTYVREAFLGLLGRSPSGRKLLVNIIIGALPILALGFLVKRLISQYLQFTGPVLIALVVGGLVMIFFERGQLKQEEGGEKLGIHELTWRQALTVGAFQCLALWPGTSRSMVTILGGMKVGLKRSAAAEFSFIVGLPVLLIATAYKGLSSGHALIHQVGSLSLLVGLATSAVFAFISVKWLVSFLNKHGLAVFGWYRLVLAVVVFLVLGV